MRKPGTEKIALYLALPPSILLLLFLILPVLCNIFISAFDIGSDPKQWFSSFISFKNYETAIMQDGFVNAIGNSIIYTLVTTFGVTAIGLLAAMCLKISFRGKGFVIALIMLSWTVPSYVVGIFFGYMFQQDNSIVNFLLFDFLKFDIYSSYLGFNWNYNELSQLIIPRWLDGKYSVLTIAVPAIWHYWPYSMLLFLEGLNSIKSDISEAAEMDGANVIYKFFYITLPILRPALIAVFVQNLITNIYSFNIVVMMFGNGTIIPSKSADLLVPYIFRTSFQYWNVGVGAALSTFLTLAVGLSVLYYYRNQRREYDAKV
jgi:multiple sugar transport system permease protein